MKTLYESIFDDSFEDDVDRWVHASALEKIFGKGLTADKDILVFGKSMRAPVLKADNIELIKQHGFTGIRVDGYGYGRVTVVCDAISDFSIECKAVDLYSKTDNDSKKIELTNVTIKSYDVCTYNPLMCKNCHFEGTQDASSITLIRPTECSFDSACTITGISLIKFTYDIAATSRAIMNWIKKKMKPSYDGDVFKFKADPLDIINMRGRVSVPKVMFIIHTPNRARSSSYITFFGPGHLKDRVAAFTVYKTDLPNWPQVRFDTALQVRFGLLD